VLSLSLAVGCGAAPPPSDPWQGTREAAQRAMRLVRERHPSQARYLQTLLQHAEAVTAVESSAPFWRRTPGRAEAAWLRVASAAAKSVRDFRREVDAARMGYLAAQEATSLAMQRAQQQIRETGLSRREAAAFARATASQEAAFRLAELGDWEGATRAMNQAREAALLVHQAWSELHSRFTDPALRRQWQHWANETIAHSRRDGSTVILVDKLNRRLDLYRGGVLVRSYPAELGANGLRRKQHSGDRATPEGIYRVVDLKSGHRTKYYKALLIDYPNEDDRARFEAARRRGAIPWRVGIGSLIEIHGAGGEGRDWTDGCVALTNQDMDEVFAASRLGTLVTIVGTYGR
jgi:L,D-peptidoglycan transpeptidase YkuD (ErfK/YbiS/YcfS/YnhG family)